MSKKEISRRSFLKGTAAAGASVAAASLLPRITMAEGETPAHRKCFGPAAPAQRQRRDSLRREDFSPGDRRRVQALYPLIRRFDDPDDHLVRIVFGHIKPTAHFR